MKTVHEDKVEGVARCIEALYVMQDISWEEACAQAKLQAQGTCDDSQIQAGIARATTRRQPQ